MSFKTERAWKYHMSKCDCGNTLKLVKMERMRSPIISTFLDNLFISVDALKIEDDLDRFNKFFHEALCKINRQDISYYIKELKKDGVVLIKGLQDLSNRKIGDKYVSFEWIQITGKEFLNYIISYLNDKINILKENDKYDRIKLLKVNDVNQYLKELKNISK
jgi:D-arabinose 1-dehydrogenase-like Zn-dependent alcohol dehydrogenase